MGLGDSIAGTCSHGRRQHFAFPRDLELCYVRGTAKGRRHIRVVRHRRGSFHWSWPMDVVLNDSSFDGWALTQETPAARPRYVGLRPSRQERPGARLRGAVRLRSVTSASVGQPSSFARVFRRPSDRADRRRPTAPKRRIQSPAAVAVNLGVCDPVKAGFEHLDRPPWTVRSAIPF